MAVYLQYILRHTDSLLHFGLGWADINRHCNIFFQKCLNVNDFRLTLIQGSQHFSGIKFHDFCMIFHDSCIIFPWSTCNNIFQVFYDFPGRWEPCHTRLMCNNLWSCEPFYLNRDSGARVGGLSYLDEFKLKKKLLLWSDPLSVWKMTVNVCKKSFFPPILLEYLMVMLYPPRGPLSLSVSCAQL